MTKNIVAEGVALGLNAYAHLHVGRRTQIGDYGGQAFRALGEDLVGVLRVSAVTLKTSRTKPSGASEWNR